MRAFKVRCPDCGAKQLASHDLENLEAALIDGDGVVTCHGCSATFQARDHRVRKKKKANDVPADVTCPHCGSTSPQGEIERPPPGLSLDNFRGCPKCHRIFLLPTPGEAKRTKRAQLRREQIAAPPHLVVEEASGAAGYRDGAHGSQPQMTVSWPFGKEWTAGTGTLIFIAVVLALGSAMAFAVFSEKDAPAPLLAMFTALFGLPCLVVCYAIVVSIVNRTTLSVTRELVTVRHGPLPWRKVCTVPAGNIHQVYCFLVLTYARSSPTSTSGHERISYDLRLKTRSGDDVILLERLVNAATALYLEQAIERALDIEDVPVDRAMIAASE